MKPANSLGITGRIGDRVFQHVHPGLGNVEGDATRTLQNRAYVAHVSSATPAQLAHRLKFKNAMIAWHALSPTEQKSYHHDANNHHITGMNLFVSQFLKA